MRVSLLVGAMALLTAVPAWAGQWVTAGSGWSYIQDSGQPIKEGWFTDNDGKVYNFNGGVTRSGFYEENGRWYYFSPTSGERVTGFITINDKMYFTDLAGVMQTGWIHYDGKWFYANPSGEIQHNGVCKIGQNNFWFYSDGHMAVNESVDSYYASSTGALRSSQWVGSNTYVNSSGKVTSNTSNNKRKLENKAYTKQEYMDLVVDHIERYAESCDDIVRLISDYRMNYNDTKVYNYSGNDDDYIDNNELPEFEESDKLKQAATLRAIELASQQRASGARPDGTGWDTVLDDYGFSSSKAVESVAFGQSDSEEVFNDLENGNSHKSYWNDKKLTKIGVGAACASDGKMYYVIIYAE